MTVWIENREGNMIHRCGPYFLVLIFLLFISGCARVGPNFRLPAAQVSANWLEGDDPHLKEKPEAEKNWWQTFNDPVLDRLVDRAFQENLSLRTAGVRVLEARAQLGIAVGGLYPQSQQALGSFQYNRVSDGAPTAAFSTDFSYRQAEIGLMAGWEIDFWGKFRRAIESADAGLWAEVADYDNVLVSLTADVANVYILIRTLEKRLAIAVQNVEIQREGLKIAEARFKYGTTSQLDVEQARTVFNDTLATIPVLKTQWQQAKNALSLLLGLPPGDLSEFLTGPGSIPVAPPEIVVGIPNDLLRRRPDIRRAEWQAAAQCAQIGVAKADYYPAFSLNGIFGFLSSDVGNASLGDMFHWGNRTIQVGPSFQWNIFNYGRITNNVRVQDARFQQVVMAYQNAVLKAQQEVEDALVGFLKTREQIEFLSKSAAAARQSLDLSVLQYQEGIKDFTTVLIAQQALLREQDTLAAALGAISSYLVGVYRSLGGGWEIRAGKDFVPPEVKEAMAKRSNWGHLLEPVANNFLKAGETRSIFLSPEW
jgi:NodT family efflux transporter outer membrane factor (OMF) lipoprotein